MWKCFSGRSCGRLYPETRRGDVGIAFADQIGVSVAEGLELAIDLAFPPALADPGLELVVAGLADPQPAAVVGQDLHLVDVVGGAAGAVTLHLRQHRVHAAGIVADHAADGGAVMRRGIEGERQAVLLGLPAHGIENHAGLHPRLVPLIVHLQDAIEVLRAVDDHSGIAGLAGEARAAAAVDDRRTVLATDRDRLNQRLDAFRDHDADRRVPVVRGVRGVDRAGAGIEAHLGVDPPAQIRLQSRGRLVREARGFGAQQHENSLTRVQIA
jgi:hypothetical protein